MSTGKLMAPFDGAAQKLKRLSELTEQLQKSLDATRCPHCLTFDPVIRMVRNGDIVIFSCAACKRIINCAVAA